MSSVATSIASRHSFTIKLLAAAMLVAAADALFYFQGVGATLGAFAFLWAAALAIAGGGMRRKRVRFAATLAILYALVLIEAPSVLGWTLFWIALSSAALLRRHHFDNAGDWALRLATYVLLGIPRPIADLIRVKARGGRRDAQLSSIARALALPCIGGTLFIALFAGANPIIGNAFASIRPPYLSDVLPHLLFCTLVAHAVWPSLRPSPLATGTPSLAIELPAFPRIPQSSITLSLFTFNAIFLVQNLLDILFLWSGAPLPGSITLADYAHRGAYLLIATAVLAGLFVLLFLQPGSPAARRPMIRYLVILWIAQNLLLVLSSILRTWDYVHAYSLTILRISALAWMALVGVGLFLICWRLIAGRSARWLLNANALAAILVLSAASITDLGATAAWWNVRHSDEVGQSGNAIDLCYLRDLRSSALLPLIDLEKRAHGPVLRDSIAAIRSDLFDDLASSQADWHRWTWRGARRLAAARATLGPSPVQPTAARYGRDCAGSRNPPPVEQPPAVQTGPPSDTAPLTNGAEQ